MVSESPVHDLKLSSVVPARTTGDDKIHELTNTDLAMKLHYIKALYFFNSDAARGIDIFTLKKPMFYLLDRHVAVSGRIRRRPDDGRPLIKCNDGGVRTVEARCGRTVDEWLATDDRTVDDRLVYSEPLGPDLGFSPLVYVQFTWFKCGGLSVGLSWAHILGDAFSASAIINMWGQIMAGHVPPQPLKVPNTTNNCQFPHSSISQKPFSLKMVDPVGDCWKIANSCEMKSHSFHVTTRTLDRIVSSTSGLNLAAKHQYFRVIMALMWKSLAKIRGESDSKVVTICANNSREGNEIASNTQVIGSVEASFNVGKADISELAKLIDEKAMDETSVIEKFVERESGQSDFVMYGANLTFVNLEEEEIYGLQIQGKRPIFANYTVGGIDEKGVVLVLPGPENGKRGNSGRTVTVIVPKNQIIELKNELKKEWGIF
ncbi:Protein ECERIFERUM like [Actinidia chinensis var. chinensis]|uniref:Protein ECERIFERUM like n=1 Tax=Actinidia chinensis var. chinensis TaxID=1590841 RepID=A0A2R6RNH1_ACTCC|nr:Protein ECERIFERUM like [Actinidia chinensis var. chinensis]